MWPRCPFRTNISSLSPKYANATKPAQIWSVTPFRLPPTPKTRRSPFRACSKSRRKVDSNASVQTRCSRHLWNENGKNFSKSSFVDSRFYSGQGQCCAFCHMSFSWWTRIALPSITYVGILWPASHSHGTPVSALPRLRAHGCGSHIRDIPILSRKADPVAFGFLQETRPSCKSTPSNHPPRPCRVVLESPRMARRPTARDIIRRSRHW